jgi:alcohol dehydrogenase YqhD (iron-dependent ADH family)
MEVFELSGIEPNPRIESVRKGAQMCKEHNIDVLLAVGGGSTIDATKFMAAGACVEHDPWDFLNEKWAPIEKALPIVTILTLSATGSEMDTAAVISNLETGDKIGRLARPLLPQVSFLDPTLTYSVNQYQTACGSVDIFSHIAETYFNMEPDLYMLDCFMEGMMKTVLKFAPVAMRDPENYEARANLMWTSSWAINGFVLGSHRKAWSCHPIEHELSAKYDIFMSDTIGSPVSDTQTIIADKTDSDAMNRTFHVRFTLKGGEFKKTESYYLVIAEKGTTNIVAREEFSIDIAFADAFDDDFGF